MFKMSIFEWEQIEPSTFSLDHLITEYPRMKFYPELNDSKVLTAARLIQCDGNGRFEGILVLATIYFNKIRR